MQGNEVLLEPQASKKIKQKHRKTNQAFQPIQNWDWFCMRKCVKPSDPGLVTSIFSNASVGMKVFGRKTCSAKIDLKRQQRG